MTAPFTPESGREAGLKSAAVRQQRRAAKKGPLWPVERDLTALVADLVRAARGEPPYENLPSTERLKALFKCLEYGIGRPEAMSKQTVPTANGSAGAPVGEDEDAPDEAEGIAFG